MQNVNVTISGISPIIMNRFSAEAEMQVSSSMKSNFRGSKGTPREQAEPKAYQLKDKRLYIPAVNIYAAIIHAGTFVKNGKSKMTTQKSSLVCAMIDMNSTECVLVNPANKKALTNFEVDSRPVVIPSTGGRIMAHRPRCDEWETSFNISFDEREIDAKLVRELVDISGQKCGLCEYRPQRKGIFGKYKVLHWTLS